MIANNMDALMVLNAVVAICADGATATVEQTPVTYGAAVAPNLPAAGTSGDYAIAAPWERIGRLSGLTKQDDSNTITVPLCEDSGRWAQETIFTNISRGFTIDVVDMTDRTFELMFGLPEGALSGEGGRPWTGKSELKCWCYLRQADHRQGGKKLFHGRMWGTLSISSAPAVGLDVARVQYTFTPSTNALDDFQPIAD